MTVTELKRILLEWKIPETLYSIIVGGLPNERLCLVKNSDKTWEIYYSERGRKSGLKLFESEEEACEYFLKKWLDINNKEWKLFLSSVTIAVGVAATPLVMPGLALC